MKRPLPFPTRYRNVDHVPDPQDGPVADAIDVAVRLSLKAASEWPKDSPVRDRIEHAIDTLLLLRDATMPELERGDVPLTGVCDMVLFGSFARRDA